MGNEITKFTFPFAEGKNGELRIVMRDDEPLFCLKDVCDCLGIDNPSKVVQRLNDKGVTSSYLNTIKGNQQFTFIDEPNLYRVIFRSDKEEAVKFQSWVFDEVLPTIRKTGGYRVNPMLPAPTANYPVTDYHQISRFARGYKDCLEILEVTGNSKIIAINNQVKQAFGVDLLASADMTYLPAEVQEQHLNPSDIAKRMGNEMTSKTVNKLLIKKGLQTASRDAKERLIYDLTEAGKQYGEYMDTGKKHSDGRPVRQIRWYASVIDRLTDTAKYE